MKNITKSDDGYYHVKGHKYELLIGSRAQVWHGTAYKTSGQLCKSDLFKNKHGRVVSKSKYESSKKEKRLLKHGYGFTKKKFVLQHKHSKKHRGGTTTATGKASTTDTTTTPSTTTKPTTSLSTTSLSSLMGSTKYGGTYSLSSNSVAKDAEPWNSSKWGKDQGNNLQNKAGSYSGGKSKKRRGGSPGHIYSQSYTGVAENAEPVNSSQSSNSKDYTISGGKSRRKCHRRHCNHKSCHQRRKRGGMYSQSNIGVAIDAEKWDSSKWGSNQGANLQLVATNYGGKKSKRKSRRKKRGGFSNPYSFNIETAGLVNNSSSPSTSSSSSSSDVTPHSQTNSSTSSASASHK